MVEILEDWEEMKPLGLITCSSYDCENDLHCFRSKKPKYQSYRNGRCVACDVELIDWDRIDKRNLKDIDYTVNSLKYELIRHHYWDKKIDAKAENHARKKDLSIIRADTLKRLKKVLGPPSSQIYHDGTQTPRSGNIIYYAQHATASCCRKCAEEWHGIDKEHSLSDDEIEYLAELIMHYISQKPPFISDEKDIPGHENIITSESRENVK